jgi:Ras-related protein Rab-7A
MSHARYKICLIGDGGVGKTTLVNRYISGKYKEDFKMTIGVDFYIKTLDIDGINVTLQIWDFAGEHRFKNLLPNYLIGASGGIYMYDISRFSSLKNIEGWMEVIQKTSIEQENYLPMILVGGKSDLASQGKRVVDPEFAKDYGRTRNLFDFLECSSKTGENVEVIFEILSRKLLSNGGLL